MEVNYNKCLQELDREVWGPAPEGASYLIETCHELRLKPINKFDIENLRVLIGQKIGLDYLIPYALIKLEQNILAEGDFYEGDLLNNCIGVDKVFWETNPTLHQEFIGIIKTNYTNIISSGNKQLLKKVETFIS